MGQPVEDSKLDDPAFYVGSLDAATLERIRGPVGLGIGAARKV